MAIEDLSAFDSQIFMHFWIFRTKKLPRFDVAIDCGNVATILNGENEVPQLKLP